MYGDLGNKLASMTFKYLVFILIHNTGPTCQADPEAGAPSSLSDRNRTGCDQGGATSR
jgi:hypothetical protein